MGAMGMPLERAEKAPNAPSVIGRYFLHNEIASGGMATVHLGWLRADASANQNRRGESRAGRVVAIKRLHPQFAKDPEFVAMFLDETRLARRIFHPNVVQALDVVADVEVVHQWAELGFGVEDHVDEADEGAVVVLGKDRRRRVVVVV